MKVLFTTKINSFWKKHIDNLKDDFKNNKEVEILEENNHEKAMDHLKNTEVLVTTALTEDMINQAPSLKIVFLPYAGMDELPFELLKKRNIIISNSHGNARVVAERAFALSLAVLGNIVQFDKDLREGIWHGFTVKHGVSDSWTPISGKKCGIIGAGRIGSNLARMLKAFDCKVYGFKKHKVDKLPENYDEISTDIDEVINKSDILYQCLPLTEETIDIISEERLMNMKDKYLINIGRGPTVNEKGLYNSLKEHILKGAGIDVWYNYPTEDVKTPPSKYDFHKLDNIIMSPHLAGFTAESVSDNIRMTIENVKKYIKDGTASSAINLEERY